MSLIKVIIPSIRLWDTFLVVHLHSLLDVPAYRVARAEVLVQALGVGTSRRDRNAHLLGMQVKSPSNPKHYDTQAQE